MKHKVSITREDGYRVLTISSLESRLMTPEGKGVLDNRFKIGSHNRDVDGYGNNVIDLVVQASEDDIDNMYLLDQFIRVWQRDNNLEHYRWNNSSEPVPINFGRIDMSNLKNRKKITHQRVIRLIHKITV